MDQVRAFLQEGEGETEGEGKKQPDERMRSQVRPFRKYSQVKYPVWERAPPAKQ